MRIFLISFFAAICCLVYCEGINAAADTASSSKKSGRHKLKADYSKPKGTGQNRWWENYADTNKDGRVDEKELEAWKKIENVDIDLNNDNKISHKEKIIYIRRLRYEVRNELEGQFDVNRDGYLNTYELKRMLRSTQYRRLRKK